MIDHQKIRREAIRWHLLQTLNVARPDGMFLEAIRPVIDAVYPDVTDQELVRELDYAIFQNNGTRPHIIKPKSKKGLFWLGAGHPVKQVKHPGLPARPFFNLTDQDKLDILTIIDSHIRSIAD